MEGKVKCSGCGHSWDKSDSSKKDMFICHQCGKDNVMKNGGWLSKYNDGGFVQPNANDSKVSMSEDFVGLGYNTKGRNYSPAFGGQFQDGGFIPSSPQEQIRSALQPISSDQQASPYLQKKDPVEFYKSFINSPEYARRQLLTGYSASPKDEEYGIPNAAASRKTRLDSLENIDPITYDTRQPSDARPGLYGGPSYININPSDYADTSREAIEAHELGHLAGATTPGQFNRPGSMSAMEQDIFRKSMLSMKEPVLSGVQGSKEREASLRNLEDFQHLQKPEESKADLNALRFMMYDKGIYDITKGNKFTETDFEKAKQNLGKDRVFKRLTDRVGKKNFVNLMNIIASADDEEATPIAMNGASMPGSVGFTYARTAGSAPSEGKYAKKTIPSAQNGKKILQDATRVDNNASDKFWGIQREVDSQNLNDDSFREKYGMPLHQFKMRDSNYASAFNRQMDVIRQNDPNYSELNLPKTDIRRRDVITPNQQFIAPSNLTGEARKQFVEFNENVIGLALPTPALEALGKIPSVFGLGKTAFQQAGKLINAENALETVSKISSKNLSPTSPASVTQAPTSWSMQEAPGLHLKSTMSDGPVSKIVEPKTGLVNVEQALAIIGKESGGPDKVALVKQGIGENIPKKMDFNEFRKVTQDQLIPLERQFSEQASNYGVGTLGYPSLKKSNLEIDLTNISADISNLNKEIEITSSPIKKHYGEGLNGEHIYSYTNKYGVQYYGKETGAIAGQERSLIDLNERLNSAISNRARNLSRMQELPIENQTLILGNKSKFGIGSSAHGNPDETLGHAHFLRDAETPDVLTVTQIQSDAFQGTHRRMPTGKLTKTNDPIDNDYIDEIGKYFDKATGENFAQKSLLDKNHQERYLQELVDYAGKRGDINKLRLPTSETAAKVQGYSKIERSTDPNFINPLPRNATDVQKIAWDKRINAIRTGNKSGLKIDYSSEHQTILKKYSDQPKTIKKLFGQEPKIVTDSKGNTWYEFDIPKSFKEGKGEIKAFKNGGVTKDNQGYLNPDNFGKVVEIDSNDITMEGVYEPLLGVSDTGDAKLMKPGKNYKFKGKRVTEFPVAKDGGWLDSYRSGGSVGINQLDAQPMKKLNQLLNFTNNPDKDNWLNKYN